MQDETIKMTQDRAEEIALLSAAVERLLLWYPSRKKAWPWRCEPTPYHVWVSEIMLQQTRTSAVVPYYERFLCRFPTVYALATADDEVLMKMWEGLGYYSRARNLKRAAVAIVEKHGGELPSDPTELLELPGIGDYTAGAIASIAYGVPAPAVDGNVLRVLMRLLARDDDIAEVKTKRLCMELLRAVYPSGPSAAVLTEGLMELGESVCIPNGEARCAMCPLADLCRAHLGRIVSLLPVRTPKKPRRIEPKTVFLLYSDGKYALCRRPSKGLLAGLWEFPNESGHLSEHDAARLWEDRGICVTSVLALPTAKHIFTHIEWHMIGYRVTCRGTGDGLLWLTPQEVRDRYALPTAFRAFESQM